METDQLDDHQNLNPKDDLSWRQGCSKARLQCIHCEDTIERQQLDEHLNTEEFTETPWLDGCQNVTIKCVHDGCSEMLERHLMKDHYVSSHPDGSQEDCDHEEPGEIQLRLKQIKQKRLSDPFEEKDIGLVVTIAWDAREKWHDVGELLGLSLEPSMFDGSSESADACFAKMIHLWLSSKEVEKCGRVLINALKSSKVDCKDAVESVKKSEFILF